MSLISVIPGLKKTTQLPLTSLAAGSEYALRLTVDVGQGTAKRKTEVPILIGGEKG